MFIKGKFTTLNEYTNSNRNNKFGGASIMKNYLQTIDKFGDVYKNLIKSDIIWNYMRLLIIMENHIKL